MDKHVPSCIRGIRLRGRNIRRNGRERSNAVCPQTELAKRILEAAKVTGQYLWLKPLRQIHGNQ